MKLATMFLIMAAIQFALIITSQGTYNEETPFWTAAQDPTNWQAIIVTTLFGSALAVGVAGFVFVGSLLLNKPDLVIFAAPVGIMIGWFIPIVSLWRMVTSETTVALGASGAAWLAGLIVTPLLILGLYSAITWWRSTFEG